MKATIWMWLVTLPNGEDRVVPLVGHNLCFVWERAHIDMFKPVAEAWAANHCPGLPLRLVRMVERPPLKPPRPPSKKPRPLRTQDEISAAAAKRDYEVVLSWVLGSTLKQIGQHLGGISQERIRQIAWRGVRRARTAEARVRLEARRQRGEDDI